MLGTTIISKSDFREEPADIWEDILKDLGIEESLWDEINYIEIDTNQVTVSVDNNTIQIT